MACTKLHKCTINGRCHTVCRDEHGDTFYDPPLSAAQQKQDAARFADMLTSRQGPALVTDTNFLAGRGTLDKQFGEHGAERTAQALRRNGVPVTASTVYDPGLARFEGDPQAVIPPGSGRDHIKRIADMRGTPVQGRVEYTPAKLRDPVDPVRQKDHQLAPDIVNTLLREKVAQDPGLRTKDKKKIRAMKEQIAHEHSRKPTS